MNSLEEYGNLFQKLGLTELVVEENDFKLKLKKVCTQNVVQDDNIQSSTDSQKQAEEKIEGKEI
ncbi:MAG: hypothetical protein J5959_11430, partial [Butyrivibrio sp.]|nr:hypothetical protein [Butyrivibrio sp.]